MNACDSPTWKSVLKNLDDVVLPIKALVAPNRPFPVSLHLGNRAQKEALGHSSDLGDWLEAHGCFLAALNAFPYGRFQNAIVKTKAYRPNWTDPDRLTYTRRAIAFLSGFLREGQTGTVTTVPGGWRGEWISPDDDHEALRNIRKAADYCREVEFLSDRRVCLAIEPEPGCAWELFDPSVEAAGPEIGWCLDTCHAAVEFQSLENLDWSRIVRVQLSAAIECDNTPEARAALAPFAEPRYLHQTRAAIEGEIIGAWPDLPDALADLPKLPKQAMVRTHYHVPLTWKGAGPLRSTRPHLTPAFFKQARATFCEVETYTYSVLPPALRPGSFAEGIAAELRWAAERYGFSSSTKRNTVSPGLA